MYATILGMLSTYRLRHISTTFTKEMSLILNQSNFAPKVMALIQGIRFIRLKIKTKHSLENSSEFITHYTTFLKQVRSDQIKQLLIEVLYSILKNVLETTSLNALEGKSSISAQLQEWNLLIKKLYESVDAKRLKKKKDMTVRFH